jgi:hypothetical protein
MENSTSHLDAIKDIQQMMHKSSKFISLSGWSGIAAGICALVGAYTADPYITELNNNAVADINIWASPLLKIAIVTFTTAFVLSVFFTYLRSKKTSTPIWGATAQRVLVSVAVPMMAGGLLILKLVEVNAYALIISAALIFYGLALINASKFTLKEVKYLGYLQLLLGLISLWFTDKGLYFWSAGFGVLHILYGIVMWLKYERVAKAN